ncbi:hypothetical protein E4U21_007127 [Claviceps maximensis]|nr:hypothetical protein E4U21_007127 [Claviceps maximensis]
MFFFFICGEQTFRSDVPGYEGMPLVPFTIKGYKDVTCNICHFQQPLKNRPDVMAMANGGGGDGGQGGGNYGPPQGAPHNQQLYG